MSLDGVRHLSYVREEAHGHVFIVRCADATGTALAGRLCYVPDAGGPLVIDGRGYRKVGLTERSANDYPLLSQFARDAVHCVPISVIDRIWDPFAVCLSTVLANDPQVSAFMEELAGSLGENFRRATGIIGSRLVVSEGIDARSDIDIALQGDHAWSAAASLIAIWLKQGKARLIPDESYPEFAMRRTELSVDPVIMRRMRQQQWWRKVLIGERLVSLSCASGLGVMPDLIVDIPVEATVFPDVCYSAGTAPYLLASDPRSELSGAMHLSWFLRKGFRGKVRGKLAHWNDKKWVWISSPQDIHLIHE